MLAAATLADLRAAVKQWSQRKNIADDVIDDFINLAFVRANRGLRIPPMERFADVVIDADGYAPIPTDYIEAKELVIVRNNQNILLERKAIHEVDYIYNLSPGCPRYFSRSGANLRIAPYDNPAVVDPEVNTMNLYYYAMLSPLVEDTDCNWLSSNAAGLVLYGALAELAAYTRDEEGQARWNSKYNEEIAILQGVEDRSEWRGSTLGVSINGSS